MEVNTPFICLWDKGNPIPLQYSYTLEIPANAIGDPGLVHRSLRFLVAVCDLV